MANSKNDSFGYVGKAVPTHSSSSASGVFNVQDINYLLSENQFPGPFAVEYLVIAGGGTLSYSLRLSYEGLSVTSTTQTQVRAIVLGDS